MSNKYIAQMLKLLNKNCLDPSVNQILTNKITNTQSNIWKVEFNPTEIGNKAFKIFFLSLLNFKILNKAFLNI
jgi:hypothetical protein